MGRLYAGVGYLTGRKLAVDSSSKHVFQGDLPKTQRTKKDP
jgi:hypothetical protein